MKMKYLKDTYSFPYFFLSTNLHQKFVEEKYGLEGVVVFCVWSGAKVNLPIFYCDFLLQVYLR